MKNKDYKLIEIIKIPFEADKGYAFFIGLQKIMEGIIPSLQIIVTAYFLDTALQILAGKKVLESIVIPIILLILLIAYSWVSAQIVKFAEVKLEFALREKFRVSITEKTAKLKYRHIENQEAWNLISRVSKNPEGIIKNAYMNMLAFISMLVRIVGILLILITKIWWASIIILIISIPLVLLSIKGGKATYKADREVSKNMRKYEYIGEVLTGREAAAERTIFDFTENINKKWKEQNEIVRKALFNATLKYFFKLKISSIITALISMLMISVLIKPVLDKAISIGLFISIVNELLNLVPMMSWQLSYYIKELTKNREYLKDLRAFSELEEQEGAAEVPSSEKFIVETVEFQEVSFKYPGTENYILNKLSFKLEKGLHYAFVGCNGAGKTTIIKLITGMYEDFEGDILINGISIRDYKYSELKAMYSIVYQDFAKYYISVKDNIALGNINEMKKAAAREEMMKAVKLINMETAIEELPKKYDTSLGRIKTDGVDLSGGQWQRLAMIRALISSASLRILDEPTAALDPISESKLYESFEEISKGATTLLISHRLGSTKLADEIFVLDAGRVIEKGSHKKLMEYGRVYAQMYKSQRSWYL